MRGLTRMKGRAGVNLNCGDKEGEVSLWGETHRICISHLPSLVYRNGFIYHIRTLTHSNFKSHTNREVLQILKMTLNLQHFWVPHCLLSARLRSQTKHICTASESKFVSVTLAQPNSTPQRHTRMTESQHLVHSQSTKHANTQCLPLHIQCVHKITNNFTTYITICAPDFKKKNSNLRVRNAEI